MAMRSTWTGAMQMGVMTFPVKAYAATDDKDIERHNLHKECKNRVNQIRVCQVCLPGMLGALDKEGKPLGPLAPALQVGQKAIPQEWLEALGKRGLAIVMPMTDDTMVKGYELIKDQPIIITDAELDTIKLKTAKAVEIVEFVKSVDFDPRMPEKHYFVAPDKKGGGVKPFSIMLQAMIDTGLYAVGRVMMRSTTGKETLVLLRPFGDVLLMHTLVWPDELRDASELRYERIPVSDRERNLGKQLVEAMLGDGDFTKHHDRYHKGLVELLLTKSEGREIKAPEAEDEAPAPADAVDALMRSIELARSKGSGSVVEQAEAVMAGVAVAEAPLKPIPKAEPAPKKARKNGGKKA
jgi:DNA end-binding protein Ku